MRKAKIAVAIIAILALGGFIWLAVHSGATTEKLELKSVQLKSTEMKLKDVNLQVEKLKTQSTRDKEKQAEQDKLLQQKEQEKQELEAKLQAKLDAKAKLELAAAQAEQKVLASHVVAAAPISGSKSDWMSASGISSADYTYVDYIVSKESGWDPCSYNPGKTNCSLSAAEIGNHACGLGQQLPCGKWAGAWNDPIAALVAMNGYAVERYGSWSGAYNFWVTHHYW